MVDHVEIFPFEHNWDQPFVESFEFKTDIFTSVSGVEQRRSLRRDPRITLEQKIVTYGADTTRLKRQMVLWASYPFAMPDWARTALSGPASAGVRVIPIKAAIPGAGAGSRIIIVTPNGEARLYSVESATASQLVTVEPLPQPIQEGSLVALALIGYIPSGMQQPQITDTVARMSVRFEADPGTVPIVDKGQPLASHNGIEVVMLRPNWQQSVDVTWDYAVFDVDFGRGAKLRYHPVGFMRPSVKWSMRGMDRARSDALAAFFHRRAGRLVPCYVPSLVNDLPPIGEIGSNATKFTVAGLDAKAYWDKNVQRAIRIEGAAGEVYYRNVTDIRQNGANSDVILDASVPRTASATISWMTKCRLASDLLVLSWRSEMIAECDLVFTALEDAP